MKTADYDPAEQIKDGLDLANSTGSCFDSWKSATKQVGETKIPKWSQFLRNADSALEPAAELGKKTSLRWVYSNGCFERSKQPLLYTHGQ